MQQPPNWGQGYGPPAHPHPHHPQHGGGHGYPPQRPPPPRSNTGVIVAAVAGGFVLLFAVAGALGARKGSTATASTSERAERTPRATPARRALQSVDKDFLDDIIVRLATSNQFMGAMAKMEDSEKSQASRLRKGEKVTVLCEGGGIVIGTPSLRDCTFAR